MAIWTFDFYIVQRNRENLNRKEEMEFDEIVSWRETNVTKNSLMALSRYFPKTKGWSEEIFQYGLSDGTNIQFFYDNSLLREISCSLDIRKITISQIEAVLEFMQDNDAVIFYNNVFYEASKENLKNLITHSTAFKFCQKPLDYFKEQDRL